MSPPREAIRRLVVARRAAAHDAAAAMLASLAPERTAGAFLDLGAAAERVARRIERRHIIRSTVR